jgi:thiol-disulfide isomerase/thioredoxin
VSAYSQRDDGAGTSGAPRPRRSFGKTAILLAVGVLALALGIYAAKQTLWAPASRDAGALLAITLPDLAGNPQRIDQWRGKVLVVNFWATWCEPCREEMPRFVKAQAADGGRGLQFVGIAVDNAAKARRFAEEIGVNYPTLVSGTEGLELSKRLGNELMALPFTVIVDRQGHVAHTQLGIVKQQQLERILQQLL